MNPFTEVLTRMIPPSDEMPVIPEIRVPRNYQEDMKWKSDIYNRSVGNLQEQDGYDCPECLNRGDFETIEDDVPVRIECRCKKIRRNLIRLKSSGLANHARKCTFENFETPEQWQKIAKNRAMKYATSDSDKWLFFWGQSGCGKTHLCTAICTELIKREYDVKYVHWRDLIHYLEANRFNEEKYSGKIQELQNIDVLYIDDFLKTTRKDKDGKIQPSETDLNIAYEIINSRVVSGKRTLISSELSISDISAFDEATGGRISESSEGSQILIKYGQNRNFRFHGRNEK